jgi:general L-amino acid transport system permease protein
VLGIFTASIIGLLIGIGRLSTNWIISKICTMYIELFRNIPVLLQILFWYNVVLASLNSPRKSIVFLESMFLNTRGLYIPKPLLQDGFIFVIISFIIAIISIIFLAKWARKRHDETGIKFPIVTVSFGIIMFSTTIVYFLSGSPIDFEYPILRGFNFVGGYNLVPELLALWLALSIYTATYIAEAVRAGIEAIDKGQSEASLSLGLSKSLMLKKVILPQALRIIIPPIINQYANLTKNSSLATAIGYPELVTIFSGTSLNQVGQAIEIILMTMAVYLIFNILVSMIMNYINAKIKIKER